jgi:DNA repair protein RecO (recombination protein O)
MSKPPGLPMAGRGRAAPLSAYVLHRYDWSESSLIVDLFTRERGRVSVAAKGAKRPYSQLRAVLLPFQRIHVTLGRSPADEHAEIHNLRQAEWAGGVPMLGGAALFSGFYLNELLMKLLARHDAHPALFDAYADTLPALASSNELLNQAALRAFELLLLRETGVLPDLSLVTLTVQPVLAEGCYQLVPESGVVATREEGGAFTGAALSALQKALDGNGTAELQAACGPCTGPLRSALRALLHYHLGSPALRTRQVAQGVQRLMDSVIPRTPPTTHLHEPARRS